MATKVFLREKKISKGRKSLYLDFYPPITNPNTGKETRREFLGIYVIEKPRNPFETQQNKESRALARSIQNQRFREIQEGIYGFQTEAKKKISFIVSSNSFVVNAILPRVITTTGLTHSAISPNILNRVLQWGNCLFTPWKSIEVISLD